MSHIDLRIAGMHCDACTRRVQTALTKVEGVSSVDAAIGSAQVQYDAARTDAAELVAAVEKIGYTASLR